MGNLLEELTLKFQQQMNMLDQGEKESLVLKKEGIEAYKDALKNERVFDVIFDVSNAKGDLSVFDMYGLVAVLEAEEFEKKASYYDTRIRSKFIGRPLSVQVLRIDEETETIYLKSAKREGPLKADLTRELLSELNNGRNPQLVGQVRYVAETHAIIDILCKGIVGYIQVADWSEGYVRDLKSVCRAGDIISFSVVSSRRRTRHEGIVFTLSRRSITGDVWKKIPLEYMEKDSVITVTCVERPINRDYWWGINDRLQGIEIMCNYTQKLEGKILVGKKYKCRVRTVNADKHIFRASPFEEIPDLTGTIKTMNLLKNT